MDGAALNIKPGVKAPDGPVFLLDGTKSTLHEEISRLRGDRGEGKAAKMTLLAFGSQTCPMFIDKLPEVVKVVKPMVEKGILTVLIVYIREAHPTDGWANGPGSMLPKMEQTHTVEARLSAAKLLQDSVEGLLDGIPFLVDDPGSNALDVAYEAPPARLVLLDDSNKVVHYTGQAPLQYNLKRFADDMAYIAMIMDD